MEFYDAEPTAPIRARILRLVGNTGPDLKIMGNKQQGYIGTTIVITDNNKITYSKQAK